MMTTHNIEIERATVVHYLYALVNRFYKILPLKESGEPTLKKYIRSLLREMLGLHDLVREINHDERYLTLISILQYFLLHIDELSIADVKSEVFRSINIIKAMRRQYGKES